MKKVSLSLLVCLGLAILQPVGTATADNGSSQYQSGQTNKEDGSPAEAQGSRANYGGYTHRDHNGRADGSFYPVRNASLQPAIGGGAISYHGGKVLQSAKIYNIYYGTWPVGACTATDNTTAGILNNYLSTAGISDWYRTTAAYYSTSGSTKTFTTSNVAIAGCSTMASSTYGTTLDNAPGVLFTDIIQNQITANGWVPNSNDIYFVFTSKEIAVTEGPTSTFNVNYCGFHSNFTPTGGTQVQYAFIGDSNNNAGCGGTTAATPNGNATADAMVSVTAHELTETVSDPLGNAWYDSRGYENGDKCAWIFGATFTANGGKANSTQSGKNYQLQENVAPNLNSCVSVLPGSVNSVSSFAPNSGPAGSSFTITGANFGALGSSYVFINGVAATITAQTTTSITATVPSTATTGPVTVVSDYGVTVTATPFTVVLPAPTITTISPASISVGATLTINGTNLGTTTLVSFTGGATATPATATATKVTVKIPAGAQSGVVTVTTGGGVATSVSTITIVASPTISGFTPAFGLVGSSVTINGTNFSGATSVKLGTSTLTVASNSGTVIVATIPTGALTGKISVTTPGGTATSVPSFTVLPVISSFTPTSITQIAAASTGTRVTISGTNLTGSLNVTLTASVGGAQTVIGVTNVSSTSARFVVPQAMALGTYSLKISTALGSSATAATSLVLK